MIQNIHSLQRRIEERSLQGLLPFLLVGGILIAAGLCLAVIG
jgi:hypothetical protein